MKTPARNVNYSKQNEHKYIVVDESSADFCDSKSGKKMSAYDQQQDRQINKNRLEISQYQKKKKKRKWNENENNKCV